ncbi:CRISPR-associated endonuclease Cas2 [Fusobacterium sp. PH5-44]|uniref:CRISPR-associated endonuclease Cas2 n=2 Tax=unclassified Fusobacterium TaxID=2648384 RepID=UPI003D19D41D
MMKIYRKFAFTAMNYRFMRVIVFFDLPVVLVEERREYSKFRRFLLKNGFIMLQESVYSKLALNLTVANAIISNVKKNAPEKGLVQLLAITEKQFSKMELIIGESPSEIISSDSRLVIL